MKVRAILTGATGMVGEGVLQECLINDEVEQVLIINRRPSGVTHPKLKEIIHSDFFNLAPIESQLAGYNACFFCLGVSSVGMKEQEYTRMTYDLTLNFANSVVRQNNDMVFCYVSGASTDSTEKGRQMWARVKGKTENDLMKLPFKKAYMFRPGFMKATKGAKNIPGFYGLLAWLYPFLRKVGVASTLKEVGLAMIKCVTTGYSKNILEIKDIIALAKA